MREGNRLHWIELAFDRAQQHEKSERSQLLFTRIGTRTGRVGDRCQELIKTVPSATLEGSDIKITLIEVPPEEDWTMRGLPTGEIDLGLETDV